MSNPFAQRRSEPATWAGALLLLVAVLAAVDGVAGVAPIGALGEATNNAYQAAGVHDSARYGEAVQADVLVALAIDVVLAVAFLALGLLRVLSLGRGTAARIGTGVVAGLGVLWFGSGFFGSPSGSLVTRTSRLSAEGADTARISREIAAHTPGWVTPFQDTLAVLIVLSLVAVIVLLALPGNRGTRPVPEPANPPARR
jgi:hypothetical protein